MVKLVYVIRARADVDPEEFHRYWREDHAPKVRAVAEAIRARKYIQSHTIDTPVNDVLIASRGLSPLYQGITEIWWDSLEDLQEAAATREGAEAMKMLAEDEARFIDLAQSTIFMTEEYEVFDLTSAD
jgi:uncharacterized protein (TIGR02118 family)